MLSQYTGPIWSVSRYETDGKDVRNMRNPSQFKIVGSNTNIFLYVSYSLTSECYNILFFILMEVIFFNKNFLLNL